MTSTRRLPEAATWLPLLVAAGLAAPLCSFAGHTSTTTTTSTSTPEVTTKSDERSGWSHARRSGRSGDGEVSAYTLWLDRNSRVSNGDARDVKEAEEARRAEGTPCLWFRRGEQSFVISDRDWLDRAERIFAPQMELGRKQGELGRRQGELGRLQGDLGRKQARLGRMQGDLARRQAITLRAETAWHDSKRSGEAAAAEREREEIEREREALGDLMTELGALQSQLGERQAALGKRQSALGAEQARLSRQVAKELDELAREAIREGVAKRLR